MVAQLGIDSHHTDPLTHLSLTVQGFTRTVARLVDLAPRLVALGGGGYDVTNVARAWTAAWATINGAELPAALPADFSSEAQRFRFRSLQLWDPPVELPPTIRQAAREFADRQVEMLRRTVFPIHRLP